MEVLHQTRALAIGVVAALVAGPGVAEAQVATRYRVIPMPPNMSWVTESNRSSSIAILVNFDPMPTGAPASRSYAYSRATGVVRLGLIDPPYVRANGFENSRPRGVMEDGRVVGNSQRFAGNGVAAGFSGWIQRPGEPAVEIGLSGGFYTSSTGTQSGGVGSSSVFGNQVLGTSVRYGTPPVADLGHSSWISDGITTSEMGLFDAEHMTSDGYVYNNAASVLQDGTVVGQSMKVGASGASSWVYEQATHATRRVGLFGEEYTRADGFQRSDWMIDLRKPYFGGSSRRFAGTTNPDGSIVAWVYWNGQTRHVGLENGEHRRADGYTENAGAMVAPSGFAVGNATRFHGGDWRGTTAWIESPEGLTHTLGFVDARHTSSDGHRRSGIWFLRDNGDVVGESARYAGDAATGEIGRTAWLQRWNMPPIPLGLFDDVHLTSFGAHESYPIAENHAGQVIGKTTRVAEGTWGSTGWFFDPADATTHALEFSVSGEGNAILEPGGLLEDGTVFGHYTCYACDVASTPFDNRGFLWNRGTGLIDLSAAARGSLSRQGLIAVTRVERVLGDGSILGYAEDAASRGRTVVLLPLSCLADVDDGSGTGTPDDASTIEDLLSFLAWFEAGDLLADVGDDSGGEVPDGGVSIRDLISFLIAFEHGC